MTDTIAIPLPRRRRRVVVAGGALGAPALVTALLLFVAAMTSTTLCNKLGGLVGGGIDDTNGKLTSPVTRAINAVSARFRVDPFVIGALAMRETAGGRAVSCSSVGACGVMQLMPGFWRANQCDGDGDGRLDIADTFDNVCAAVNGLIHDKRTLIVGRRMTRSEIATMARSYCGSCTAQACGGGVDGGYCEGVVRNFERLGGTFGDGGGAAALADIPLAANPSTQGACSALAAATPPDGEVGWTVAPGANLPGHPLAPVFVAFMNEVAQLTTYRPILTTGTNHSEYTVDGNVSDHYTGNAGDFGSAANGFGTANARAGQPVPRGDELAAAAFVAAGADPRTAHAWALDGGLRNVVFTFQGQRVRLQVIWKTDEGGDHHNHVHVGVRPT